MLHTLLLTQRATPYIYYGDELGMTNIRFTDIADYRDLQTINTYNRLIKEGGNVQELMAGQAELSRDNGRTPMQWSAGPNAGFTGGTPWLKVNSNLSIINTEAQEKDPNSVLQYFRRMIQLRKAEPALVYGKYELLDAENPEVYAYTRSLDGKTFLIALSFSTQGGRMTLPKGFEAGEIRINNLEKSPVQDGAIVLEPYQAVVLELRNR